MPAFCGGKKKRHPPCENRKIIKEHLLLQQTGTQQRFMKMTSKAKLNFAVRARLIVFCSFFKRKYVFPFLGKGTIRKLVVETSLKCPCRNLTNDTSYPPDRRKTRNIDVHVYLYRGSFFIPFRRELTSENFARVFSQRVRFHAQWPSECPEGVDRTAKKPRAGPP